MFLRQILARSRHFCRRKPEQRRPTSPHSELELSGQEIVAKPTTGQQPRAIHSRTHLQRVREGCAGSAGVRWHLAGASLERVRHCSASERHQLSPSSRTARRRTPRTLLAETPPRRGERPSHARDALRRHLGRAGPRRRRRARRAPSVALTPETPPPPRARRAPPSPALINTGHLATRRPGI